jgi:hypothetical protein
MKNSKFLIVAVLCLLGVVLTLEIVARLSYHTFKFNQMPLKDEVKTLETIQSKGVFKLFSELETIAEKDSISNSVHNGLTFQQKILVDQSRFTGENNSNKTIEIYGCSYCYGIGLNDSQTLGYKLQSQIEEFKVKNYCIISAGIPVIYAHFLARINDSTQVVVINYCNFQQERNTSSRWFTKIIARSSTKNMFAILKQNMLVPVIKNDTILYSPLKNSNFFLVKKSALVNLIDDLLIYNKQSKISIQQTSKVLLKMQEICKDKGIQFVVNNGDGHQYTKKHLEHFKKIGVNVLDLNIDIGSPEYNLIKDSHPNEKANTEMAKGIEEYIREEMD